MRIARSLDLARALGAVALLAGACASPPPVIAPGAPIVFPAPPDAARFVYERTLYGSADVVAEDRSADLRRMITGEGRNSEGLAKPYAVAVHRGRIYVSDSAERDVKVFDFPRHKYYRIGQDDPGRILKPLGLDVDGAGMLYVADATAHDIKVFDGDGKFRR